MKLTIIIPTTDRPEMLARALRSIETQTDTVEEIIVVHDMPSCVARYDHVYNELKHMPINRVVHESNRGPSGARNTGIKMARTDWVIFLDDDDVFLPESLSVISDRVSRAGSQCAVVSFDALVMTKKNIEKRSARENIQKYGSPFWAEMGAFAVRLDILKKCGGFDASMRVAENRDLVVRLLQEGDAEYEDVPVVKLDYSHSLERGSSRAGTLRSNLKLLIKNEDIFSKKEKWHRSIHLFVACHAAKNKKYRCAIGLYMRWLGVSSRRLDLQFVASLLASSVRNLHR